MNTLREQLTSALRDAFSAAFPGASLPPVEAVPSTRESFGDFQCNAAMAAAKSLHLPPRDLAARWASAFTAANPGWTATVAGPGFLNLAASPETLARHLEAMSADPHGGLPQPGAGRTAVLDYSSPNVAKPMHIAHIRSTVIGDALKRILRALGWRVIADNHLGDWGTQFGILIMGYRAFADPAALEKSPVDELQRVYVLSHARCAEDPAWKDQCRAELVKLQAGDPDNLALWRHFIDLSMAEFDRMYARLGVSFDLTRGESHYHPALPGVVNRLQKAGLIRESEGALVAFLDSDGLPPCIVRKSDGGFNYATTDIATVLSRVAEFSPDEIIYVTDERQQLHFKQFFTLVRKLGVTVPLRHVWFGLMRLPDGLMSTRNGTAIKLEDLLDEAERRALALVQQASPDMPADQQTAVARAVGIGAVKYADLSQNPQTAVTFTWEKALAMNGNSAPYLQYAHARIASVRDKYRERFPDGDFASAPVLLDDPHSRRLALRLARLSDAVLEAARLAQPSVLADALYDLAQTYSTYYQNVPFLKAEPGVRESRVRLCDLTARALRLGLSLLGIDTPERI
ncbi:MAG: arginine--tRNA ligase [Kiritimatiellae bacterium]|nr:arginine--tRNA ligase [Kiritimatiellia bacterium]